MVLIVIVRADIKAANKCGTKTTKPRNMKKSFNFLISRQWNTNASPLQLRAGHELCYSLRQPAAQTLMGIYCEKVKCLSKSVRLFVCLAIRLLNEKHWPRR